MNVKKLSISLELYYMIGSWCFFIIAAVSSFLLISNFKNIPLPNLIIQIVFIIFYLLTFLLFYTLYNQLKPDITETYASDNIEEIIKNVKNNEK